MRSNPILTRLALALAVGLFVSQQAHAQRYDLVDLGTLGGERARVDDINETLQMVGRSDDLGQEQRAFLWTPDTAQMRQLLGLPTDEPSLAAGLNDAPLTQVVGTLGAILNPRTAFVWDELNGSRQLPALGGDSSGAADVNDAGAVVGFAALPGIDVHASLWLPAALYGLEAGVHDLGTIDAADIQSLALAVNTSGQIVGSTFGAAGGRAFLWLPRPAYGLPAGMSDLGNLGAGRPAAAATDVNDQGQVVGAAGTATGELHAFLWLPAPAYSLPAGMNDLGTLGTDSSSASEINGQGQIVGLVGQPARTLFLWEPGRGMTDLVAQVDPADPELDPGMTWLSVSGPISTGEIAATGRLSSGADRAFVFRPIGQQSLPQPGLLAEALIESNGGQSVTLDRAPIPGAAFATRGRTVPTDEFFLGLGAQALALVPGRLGVKVGSSSPPPTERPPGSLDRTRARAIASWAERECVQGTGDKATLDFTVIAEGVLGSTLVPEVIINGGGGAGRPSRGQLLSSLRVQVTVYTDGGACDVFDGTATVDHNAGLIAASAPTPWTGDFEIVSEPNAQFARLDFFDTITACEHPVSTDCSNPLTRTEFTLEVRLQAETQASFVSTRFKSAARVDFFDSFQVDVSTPTPGAEVVRVSSGPLPGDSDLDGRIDAEDNCVATPNFSQADSDGDGIGDACECGDYNQDGRVDTTDARLIQRCAVEQLFCQGLCDVTGEGDCNTSDARLIQRLAVGQLTKQDLRCAERP